MSHFDPDYYRQYRPFYPPDTFLKFNSRLVERRGLGPYTIADIGCGTGHSALSLLRKGISAQLIGVDPDPEMLFQAERMLSEIHKNSYSLVLGCGEATTLSTASIDAITVGSAFHWMAPVQAKDEFKRILKPKGFIRLFEYQFPKALNHPDLNEWIRRQFNIYWKAPNQKPRGTFKKLTEVFWNDCEFEFIEEGQPSMIQVLSSEDLKGLLLSQSRVLHYENTLGAAGKEHFRSELSNLLATQIGSGAAAEFDFKLSWVEYGLR